MIKRLIILFLVFFCFSCSASGLKTVEISRDGKSLAKIKVEVATTPAERAKGLMFRKELPTDQGMWFVFDRDVTGPFWMENTFISLDIIFVDKDNKIISIATNAVPLSKEQIYPKGFYRYVLEINAGLSDKFGLKPGDAVRPK